MAFLGPSSPALVNESRWWLVNIVFLLCLVSSSIMHTSRVELDNQALYGVHLHVFRTLFSALIPARASPIPGLVLPRCLMSLACPPTQRETIAEAANNGHQSFVEDRPSPCLVADIANQKPGGYPTLSTATISSVCGSTSSPLMTYQRQC